MPHCSHFCVCIRCVVYLLWLAGLAVAGTDRDSSARVFTGVRALGLVISVSTLLGMWAFNILYKGVQYVTHTAHTAHAHNTTHPNA